MPNATNLAALQAAHLSCVRLSIGDNAQQYAYFEQEAAAWYAAGATTIIAITYDGTPPPAVFQAPGVKWVELGNELDVSAPNSTATMTPAQAVSYSQAMAAEVRAANPAVKITSGGTSGYNTAWLAATIPPLIASGSIDAVGVHPYGVSPSNFGNDARAVYETYNLPVAYTEFGDTPGNPLSPTDIVTADDQSYGVADISGYYDLDSIENNVAYETALATQP
ncbi:MAG: glycosyl hydrolase [Candidatus Baltobacteraceae bacterium]|jgi:hypothetical protein